MKIPERDIIAGLPIRWAFHVWKVAPSRQWEFTKWREYLLSWDKDGIDLFLDYLDDDQFEHDTRNFLIHFRADTLIGFIRFYQHLISDYELILQQYNACDWFKQEIK